MVRSVSVMAAAFDMSDGFWAYGVSKERGGMIGHTTSWRIFRSKGRGRFMYHCASGGGGQCFRGLRASASRGANAAGSMRPASNDMRA